MLADNHVKVRNELCALIALNLMHGVSTIGQIFGLVESVCIGYQQIAFAVFCGGVRTCGFQIHLKFRADFGCFDLRIAVVVMLDNRDFAENRILCNHHRNGIVFDCKVFRFCADMVHSFVEQISLRRNQLAERPILTADVFLGCERIVTVCCIGINELVAVIDTVYSTFECCVPLRFACNAVLFLDGYGEFLERVFKGCVCNGIPFYIGCLRIGNHVLNACVDFLERIAATNENIFKICLACAVGDRIGVDFQAAVGRTEQMESMPLKQTVLGGFGDG